MRDGAAAARGEAEDAVAVVGGALKTRHEIEQLLDGGDAESGDIGAGEDSDRGRGFAGAFLFLRG